jgi:hypothetical protein
MIGVVAARDEHPVVEELFELFKTPWEFYVGGRAYDVVIVASGGEVPNTDAQLLLIYDSRSRNSDVQYGFTALSRQRGGDLTAAGHALAIYGDVLTFAPGNHGTPVAEAAADIAGLTIHFDDRTITRIGYDLFEEVRYLLSKGQPADRAQMPTLDVHIAVLRRLVLAAGIPLVEIPPAPADHSFIVCLTHDIDFVGIRDHLFDHTMFGFLYRSTVGACRNWLRGRISAARMARMWAAAIQLPFVYLKWAADFWDAFSWYLRIEQGLAATYFLIPVKGRAGERVPGPIAGRRAARYEVNELTDRIGMLMKTGCEIGVHGIDAWHSVEKARLERLKIAVATHADVSGVRMHWLLREPNTASVLDTAGYAYDAGLGYNETVGYLNGTSQAFRPLGVRKLLELPLHIQDGALFFPERLDLTERQAEDLCQRLVDNATRFGGVLTVLWHDRSHGPERFWGDFYIRLVQMLRSRDAWFGTAAQVVSWFRKRRAIRFTRLDRGETTRVALEYHGQGITPAVKIRVHRPDGVCIDTPLDVPRNGHMALELDAFAPQV